MPAFAKACKKVLDKGFDIHYVDGFAGSGINVINGAERAGSALLALAENFTKYHFVEEDSSNFAALTTRVNSHPKKERVQTLLKADFNLAIDEILAKINRRSPTFFFIDPTGLHINWETMQKIGAREKADLFILVSASTVARNAKQAPDTITRFFGTEEWAKLLNPNESPSVIGKSKFSRFMDFYAERLEGLGFTTVEQHLIARNNTNAAMHGFIFAAKNNAANNIAADVLDKITSGGQARLL